MDEKSTVSIRTKAAIAARWGTDTPSQRWDKKISLVIQLIAGLGWSTVEMVNFYLGQSKRDWATRMIQEKWLQSKLAIIDDRPATILVLTPKGHKFARELFPFIGRRVDREATRQSRHDFIAAWFALKVLNHRYNVTVAQGQFAIFSDRVMRGYIYNESVRPDISVIRGGKVIVNIEVERTRKTNAFEKYQFFKKLQNYQINEIKTVLVFESRSSALRFTEDMTTARNIGIEPWFYNAAEKRWYRPLNHSLEQFYLKVMIGVWDYSNKEILDLFIFDGVN